MDILEDKVEPIIVEGFIDPDRGKSQDTCPGNLLPWTA